MMNLIKLTKPLAEAILDMDDHGFSESLGPYTEEASNAWWKVVAAAEKRIGRESNSTAHSNYQAEKARKNETTKKYLD